jgi:hypothetical protein
MERCAELEVADGPRAGAGPSAEVGRQAVQVVDEASAVPRGHADLADAGVEPVAVNV